MYFHEFIIEFKSSFYTCLQNSQLIVQKTRLANGSYPSLLPPGCSLRLHPHFLHKCRQPATPPAPRPPHRRFFTLAHNASLLPLAKSPAQQGGREGRPLDSKPHPLPPLSPNKTVDAGFAYSDSPGSNPPLETTGPPRLPCSTPTVTPTVTSTMTPVVTPTTTPAVSPAYVLLQMAWTPSGLPQAAPTESSSQQALRQSSQVAVVQPHGEEADTSASPSTLSPLSSCMGEAEGKEEQEMSGVLNMNGGENGGGGEEQKMEGEGGGTGGNGGDGEGEQQEEASDQREEEPGESDGGGGGEEDGEKDKDEEQERQGDEEEEEEEEDFDELTQDEDEEEVMSSASEESVLSVPELQVIHSDDQIESVNQTVHQLSCNTAVVSAQLLISIKAPPILVKCCVCK